MCLRERSPRPEFSPLSASPMSEVSTLQPLLQFKALKARCDGKANVSEYKLSAKHLSWSHTARVRIPPPPHASCATWGDLLTSLNLNFPICKLEIIMEPTGEASLRTP